MSLPNYYCDKCQGLTFHSVQCCDCAAKLAKSQPMAPLSPQDINIAFYSALHEYWANENVLRCAPIDLARHFFNVGIAFEKLRASKPEDRAQQPATPQVTPSLGDSWKYEFPDSK